MLYADCISIFPDMFEALTGHGITRRAHEAGLWRLRLWNPREFSEDGRVDDRPYGGGPGMVMQVGPLANAIASARRAQQQDGTCKSRVIALSPQGAPLTHGRLASLARAVQDEHNGEGLILLCGRYEGIDERLLQQEVDEEIAVGDFVVSGGELPAMLLLDALVRLLPGALGDERSAASDSFAQGLLDCPHYTRPPVFDGEAVPSVLMSGDHMAIWRWRLKMALSRTRKKRPDLYSTWRKIHTRDDATRRGELHHIFAVDGAGVDVVVDSVIISQLLAEIESEEQCGEN